MESPNHIVLPAVSGMVLHGKNKKIAATGLMWAEFTEQVRQRRWASRTWNPRRLEQGSPFGGRQGKNLGHTQIIFRTDFIWINSSYHSTPTHSKLVQNILDAHRPGWVSSRFVFAANLWSPDCRAARSKAVDTTSLRQFTPSTANFTLKHHDLQLIGQVLSSVPQGNIQVRTDSWRTSTMHSVLDEKVDLGHGIYGPDIMMEVLGVPPLYRRRWTVFPAGTIEMIFPRVLGNEWLVSQLVDKLVEAPDRSVFHFNAEGKCIKYDIDMDIVSPFKNVVKDPAIVDILLGRALISESGLIGSVDEARHIEAKPNRRPTVFMAVLNVRRIDVRQKKWRRSLLLALGARWRPVAVGDWRKKVGNLYSVVSFSKSTALRYRAALKNSAFKL
ncbi:hypothetical protein ON010_g6483 [Phytophthora cinnamomi]|nr:hypothetical protein ON010_g6483 [Phytophthora cinnamomi]